MDPVGGDVLFLERLDAGQDGSNAGGLDPAEAREEALLLIGSVLRGGLAEVPQGGIESRPCFAVQGASAFGDAQEDVEEALDAAVAIAEQADGSVKLLSGFAPMTMGMVSTSCYADRAGRPVTLVTSGDRGEVALR